MTLALGLTRSSGAQASGAQNCPGLAGHYRVDGFGPVLGDALDALDLRMAGFTDSEVKITGRVETSLQFWIKSGGSSPMSNQPSRTLTHGVDYDCVAGAVVLKRKVSASRNSDEGWLEGSATVRLVRSGSGLGLASEFSGRQRTTIYSYDSARISLPKFGTSRTFAESIRWPNISEPRPFADTYVAPPESEPVQAMRRTLTASLLGSINLGGLQGGSSGVLASLHAPRSEDVIAFEDRLHAAGIAYDVTRSPIWSNNGYSMQFRFGAGGGDVKAGWHPSVFRVQHEIERMQHPMVSVSKVEVNGDVYVATLDVIGPESTEMILKRLRLNTTMFVGIEVLDDLPTERRNLRQVRLRLTMK
ncbi:MAG: hypothetical protein IT478_05985 [Xanthomonadales bacterium]|nr:hypothetical protein [Xanthomonadales bacterium]